MKTYDIINEASPIPYVKDFLTRGEADAIFSALQALTPVRDRNKRNSTTFIRMLRYGTYVVNPTARTKAVYGPKLDILDLPDILKPLRAKLSEYAGKDINYLSILGYADQYDHINMHQHKEDNVEEDASVYVASFGHMRELVTRPLVPCVNPDCKDAKKGPHMHGTKDRNLYETIMPEHGSLYVLPHSYNTTHEHEVPDSKYECGLRISINCKHEDSPDTKKRVGHAGIADARKDMGYEPEPPSPEEKGAKRSAAATTRAASKAAAQPAAAMPATTLGECESCCDGTLATEVVGVTEWNSDSYKYCAECAEDHRKDDRKYLIRKMGVAKVMGKFHTIETLVKLGGKVGGDGSDGEKPWRMPTMGDYIARLREEFLGNPI